MFSGQRACNRLRGQLFHQDFRLDQRGFWASARCGYLRRFVVVYPAAQLLLLQQLGDAPISLDFCHLIVNSVTTHLQAPPLRFYGAPSSFSQRARTRNDPAQSC